MEFFFSPEGTTQSATGIRGPYLRRAGAPAGQAAQLKVPLRLAVQQPLKRIDFAIERVKGWRGSQKQGTRRKVLRVIARSAGNEASEFPLVGKRLLIDRMKAPVKPIQHVLSDLGWPTRFRQSALSDLGMATAAATDNDDALMSKDSGGNEVMALIGQS